MCRQSYFCLLVGDECKGHPIFSASSVVSCDFSALCVYSKFGHMLPTFCAKFRFFHGPIAELARGEKSRTQSINQSLSRSLTHSPSLFDAPGTEAFASEHTNYAVHLCTLDLC